MATKKATVNKNTVKNETKVVCPVCGSEFAIGEHEHTVKNATVIGADSGLGTVYLPVSKRAEALNAAGIGTKKYFSMNALDGSECLMTYDDNGRPVPVDESDPVIRQIIGGGTVPNKNLFRRWVMSQVFHGLQNRGGFTEWLRWHGYDYQWEMIVEELRVQAKLYGRDMENYMARNRWFNQKLCEKMAEDYIEQLRKDANGRPTHNCKGVPYIKYDCKNIFVSDIGKKLVWPMHGLQHAIRMAKTPQKLYEAVRAFWKAAPKRTKNFSQCAVWKDAYKGMGAYATMQNLLRFHGCTFPKDNDFYSLRLSGLEMLEHAATAYGHDGGGWRLFGLMKQMIEENHIDIKAKMKQWAEEKEAKRLRR